MNGVNMIRLRARFFAVNLNPKSSSDVRSALNAAAPKRDSVIYMYIYTVK
jgi:hypothetical protein